MKPEKREPVMKASNGAGVCAAALMILFGASGTAAFAHDPSLHKAKALHGVVAEAGAGTVTVKTGGKETTYSILPDTKILSDEKKLGASALEPGTAVEVYSTKLPGGKVVATEINLVGDSEERSGREHTDDHGR